MILNFAALTLAVFGAFSNFVLVAVQAILVIFLVDVVLVGSGVAGLLMASLGLGAVIGAVVSNGLFYRFGTARTMVWC